MYIILVDFRIIVIYDAMFAGMFFKYTLQHVIHRQSPFPDSVLDNVTTPTHIYKPYELTIVTGSPGRVPNMWIVLTGIQLVSLSVSITLGSSTDWAMKHQLCKFETLLYDMVVENKIVHEWVPL